MTPSEWARDKIESQVVHAPVLWAEDPYGVLEPQDAKQLAVTLASRGRSFVLANNAFRLREQLLHHRPGAIGLVVVDQSCTPRDASHRRPQRLWYLDR